MITVFYADKIVSRHDSQISFNAFAKYMCTEVNEIYNGAYVHDASQAPEKAWYSMDGCPRLLEDIPKKLRLAVLVLS